MPDTVERRTFLGLSVAALGTPFLPLASDTEPSPDLTPDFPRQDAALVLEMVGVSHGNLERVKQLLAAKPALARAAVDWGYGDWETALGAACHTGRREIAQLLIETGARPTLFSAAMLGHHKVVEASIEAMSGVQRVLGPHSITLMAHAKAGGEPARRVVELLERVGGADAPPATVELPSPGSERYLGIYQFGPGPTDQVEVALDRGALSIRRTGGVPRNLRYVGEDAFHPVGAESVRIRFAISGGSATAVSVYDPNLILTATRKT